MRKVLTLAYMFPPIGGAGVQRNSKFVRYLPEFGYAPTVVTGPGETDDHWTPTDRSLASDIPEEVTVERLPDTAPPPTGRLRALAGRVFMVPPRQLRWWIDGSVQIAGERVSDYDLVYASLVPYEIGEAAMRISQHAGRPWIADLQDPWALDEMWLYPTGLHRRIDLRRMRRVLGSAAAIVMNTPEASSRLKAAFPEFRDKRVVSIPNGFDTADFASDFTPAPTERFRIVHTGYLHTEAGLRLREVRRARKLLGGWAYEVDILTRSHVYLLEALRLVVADDPSAGDEVELVLAGVLTEADRSVARNAPVTVTLPGYVDHVASVRLVRSADLLFLPMHDLTPGVRAGLVPGKTYEYLASGRPILAAVPDGDARDLLAAAGTAFLARPADVDAMASILKVELDRWRKGQPSPELSPRVIAPFERRALTRELAALFDEVAPRPFG